MIKEWHLYALDILLYEYKPWEARETETSENAHKWRDNQSLLCIE